MFVVTRLKFKNRNIRHFIVLLYFALLLILLMYHVAYGVKAAEESISWRRVPVPLEGDPGGWVLAEDADITCLEMSADGSLYCHATPSETIQTMFKSTDKGRSWIPTGGVTDDIIAIATVPGSNMEIYYATVSRIYKSIDSGYTFIPLPELTVGVGSGNFSINCIDVYKNGESNLVVVGTADSDDNGYGGVYILDEGEAVPDWVDTNIGECNVYSLAFSPDYSNNGRLIAVVADQTNTYICTRADNGNWDQDTGQAVIHDITTVSAVITFPVGYQDTPEGSYLFVGVNSGTGLGDVFRIELETAPVESAVIDLDIGSVYGLPGVDVVSLDSGGSSSTWLYAGSADNSHVYFSEKDGTNWKRCIKSQSPSGQHITRVLLDSDFTTNNRIYAASTGTESGLSCSADRGTTWNQISLIDTKISSGCIADLAVSPRYSDDLTMFMLTLDTNHLVHSVWRTENGGKYWERVFSSNVNNGDYIEKIDISPLYGATEEVLYLAGTSNGTSVIWKTTDKGKTFTIRNTPLKIDEWVIVNDEEFLIGCYDGYNSLVYRSSDSGQTYSKGALAGKAIVTSISVSPEYTRDGVILAGNADGEVYCSEDSGLNFRLLPADSETSPINGRVFVAFDPGFPVNHIVYATGDMVNNGIYRFTIDRSDEWGKIDETLPDGGLIRGLRVSRRGVLYAINAQTVSKLDKRGGLERSLDPASQLSPVFETIVEGLNIDSVLYGIWLVEDRVWTIDRTNTRLLTYHDTMASPVVLRSPVDGNAGIDTDNILLDWEELTGATEYTWQVDYDGTFTSMPSGFEGETSGNSVRLPELDTDTGYYWRVKAIKPVSSPWSDRWSFTTTLGQTVVGPKLISPSGGADLISLEPIFQWSAVAGAEKYELIVSTDVSFINPVIGKTGRYALPATAWKSDKSLEEGNTYYWKVRAIGSDSYGDWSAVSIFTTRMVEVSEPAVIEIKSPITLSPEAGSESVSVRPLFQWDAVSGADSYELVVSTDASFNNSVILKAGEYSLKTTAWKSNITLENDTTYYWKIRTLIDGSCSDWSRVSAFSTEIPYQESANIAMEEVPVMPVQSHTSSPSEGLPDWALYLGIGLLAAIVLLQTTTFFIVVLKRR